MSLVRNLSFGVFAVMMLLGASVACVSSTPVRPDPYRRMMAAETPCGQNLPVWANLSWRWKRQRGAAVYGMGCVADITPVRVRFHAVKDAARRDIAAYWAEYVGQLLKLYENEKGNCDWFTSDVRQHVEERVNRGAKATLDHVRIDRIDDNPVSRDAYALAMLDLNEFTESLAQHDSANSQFQQLDVRLGAWMREHVLSDAPPATSNPCGGVS